ncbi:recombinase family protein [Rhizobium leguminosarum]|uniref:recombinase family protein n=1 Tax=Rhizobium TaxID=379 RepID=UPI003D7C15F5
MTHGPRAAIYGRFSTDLQNERSTQDQTDLCDAFAKREGYHVVARYADKAKSGASLHGRDGIQRLLGDAQAGLFQIIIVEALDRLSRDMHDLAGMYKRLQFIGCKIIEVHGGEASTMTVGMRGLFAQLFREDNVHKVRRGMSGLLKQGLSAGGKAFAYQPDPSNPGKPRIVESEAEIVRRIFAEYERGRSPKSICKMLNGEGVKPPRGKLWTPSALIGAEERGSGILRNSQYVGRIVWNKNQMVKDPDTGKRVSRANPANERQAADAPELRIISDELFRAVQAQLSERAHKRRPDNMVAQRRPKRLLSGLIKCKACGAGMSVSGVDKSNRTRLRCSAHTNSGACPNPKTFYLEEVEALVIDSLTRELASPAQIQAYAKAHMEQRQAEAAHEGRRQTQIKARLADIQKKNGRLLELILNDVGDAATLSAKMKEQGEERDRLEEELTSLPPERRIIVNPASIASFAERLSAYRPKLEMALYMLDEMGELPRIVRELIKSISVTRDEDGKLSLAVTSWLKPFLAEEGAPVKASRGWGVVTLVAEEGFEPPTQGL